MKMHFESFIIYWLICSVLTNTHEPKLDILSSDLPVRTWSFFTGSVLLYKKLIFTIIFYLLAILRKPEFCHKRSDNIRTREAMPSLPFSLIWWPFLVSEFQWTHFPESASFHGPRTHIWSHTIPQLIDNCKSSHLTEPFFIVAIQNMGVS